MDTILMNLEDSNIAVLQEGLSNVSSKRWFVYNFSIYYTLENGKKANKNNKFKIWLLA